MNRTQRKKEIKARLAAYAPNVKTLREAPFNWSLIKGEPVTDFRISDGAKIQIVLAENTRVVVDREDERAYYF